MAAQIVKMAYELECLCKKADVVDMPRVSIVFSNLRDKAVFIEEIARELSPTNLYALRQPYNNLDEITINGIKVRIL